MQRIMLFNSLIVAALLLSACAAPTPTPGVTATAVPRTAALPATPTGIRATAVPTPLPATATLMPATAVPKRPSPTATGTTVAITACPGALPVVHWVGKKVMVSMANDVPDRVRAKPSRQAELVGQLSPGRE